MKDANSITDRAKRYRANRTPPPGPRQCQFCGSKKNVDIDHIWGDERDGSPANLMYLCRSCNSAKAYQQARHNIGIRTAQFNPERGARTAAEWRRARDILLGVVPGPVGAATRIVYATNPQQRARFGQAMKNPEIPTFAQYAYAVSVHQGRRYIPGSGFTKGAHDEGGAIIHATPPAVRRKYAKEIARGKRTRAAEVPF